MPAQDFERQLSRLAQAIGAGRLVYDDRNGGDLLALSHLHTQGLAELQVHRDGKSAILILLADGPAAVRPLVEAVRKEKPEAKGKHAIAFFTELEEMGGQLLTTYSQRARRGPVEAFAALQQQVPGVAPMVGVEGLFGAAEHHASALAEGDILPSRFGARVPYGKSERAALFDGTAFRVGQRVAKRMSRQAGPDQPESAKRRQPPRQNNNDDGSGDSWVVWVGDEEYSQSDFEGDVLEGAVEYAFDIDLDGDGSGCDWLSFDLPDCMPDCDLPDCAPDCDMPCDDLPCDMCDLDCG